MWSTGLRWRAGLRRLRHASGSANAPTEPIETTEGWLKAVRLGGTTLEITYTRHKGESIERTLAKLER